MILIRFYLLYLLVLTSRSFVIQAMGEFDSPDILDAANFVFFKGINTAAQNGVLSAEVANGVPPGNYRLASINTDSNHAPAIAAVAQHGYLDDITYVRWLSLSLVEENLLTPSAVHRRIDASHPSSVKPTTIILHD